MQTCRNVKSKEVRRSNLKLQKTVQEAFGKHKNTIALCVIKKCLFCSPYRGFSCSPYRILCSVHLIGCSPYRDSTVVLQISKMCTYLICWVYSQLWSQRMRKDTSLLTCSSIHIQVLDGIDIQFFEVF
jgi:hypothetical protein